jgi:hypothetical protein
MVEAHGIGGGMVSRAVAITVILWGAQVHAQPKSAVPALVGATETQKLTAPTGFIDDAIASDDQRLAYVIADGSAKAELHLTSTPETVVDLAPVTLHPLTLTLLGPRVFVTGLDDQNQQVGAMLELATKKIVYKVGPATHVTVITRDGAKRIAVHRVTGTRHEVELDALETGRRVAAGKAFELDASNTHKPLDLHVNHWSDGWTKAYGIKGGGWDRKENQRSPDVEATYDLVTGKLTDRHPIQDLFEQRKRYQVLETSRTDASLDFVRMSWDNTGIVAWRAGKQTPIELDQPLAQYDPASLQGVLQPDGTTWLALAVDPVNSEAVARKKADPAYLDVFLAGPDGKAVRKMRVLATGTRFRLGVIRDKVWLLERSAGFDRGGKTLTIYTIN